MITATVNFPNDYKFNPEIDRRMTRSFISPHTVVEEFEEFDTRARVDIAADSLLSLRYDGTKIEPTL